MNDKWIPNISKQTPEAEYWTALGITKVLQGEGVKLTNGESYNYQVLSVPARNPNNRYDLEDAKFVVRDCYPKVWKILEPQLGRPFSLLIRGAPGIGKSLALAKGFLLYKFRQTMMNGNKLNIDPTLTTLSSLSTCRHGVDLSSECTYIWSMSMIRS